METIFSLIPAGAPFQLFSQEHLAALALIVAINLGIAATLGNDQYPRAREIVRWGLVALSVINQIAWNWWQVSVGIWEVAYSMPLQICTLSEALCTIMLITRSRRLYLLLFFWCLAGAGNGLITPDLLSYSYPHFKYWIFFSAHGANVTAVVFMTVAYGYRPYWRTIWQVFLATNLYLGTMFIVNALTGGNYMYVSRKPEFATAIDYMGPWPWYILGLELLGLLSFALVYLPFGIRDGLAVNSSEARSPYEQKNKAHRPSQ
jgi:hypothetical integral membrane protein (TIGR02206 family)